MNIDRLFPALIEVEANEPGPLRRRRRSDKKYEELLSLPAFLAADPIFATPDRPSALASLAMVAKPWDGVFGPGSGRDDCLRPPSLAGLGFDRPDALALLIVASKADPMLSFDDAAGASRPDNASADRSSPKESALPVTLNPPEPISGPPVTFSIKDQRPDWEKHSRDAYVDFVALEDCYDPPWNLLADAIQRETGCWRDRPCRATLELYSFRVVIKPQPEEDQPPSDGSHGSLGGLHGGGGKAALGLLFLPGILVAEGLFKAGGEVVHAAATGRFSRPALPGNLTDEYQSGITCEVRGWLVLSWTDGRTRPFEVVGVANNGAINKDSSSYLGGSIHEMTEIAIRHLADNWRGQLSRCSANP
jgi:hypothetical protein